MSHCTPLRKVGREIVELVLLLRREPTEDDSLEARVGVLGDRLQTCLDHDLQRTAAAKDAGREDAEAHALEIVLAGRINIHVDDVYDEYWPTMLPKMYTKLGEKLAEISNAANGDEAAPKRKATDSPAKAGKARKTA